MRQATVLIADDNPTIRMDLRTLLTQFGHIVVGEAESGGQALSLARSLRPDVVLVEIVLPALSGLEVTRVLTAERVSAVLLLTGASDEDILSHVDDCGAMGFLSKPLRPTDLRAAIAIALARFRERIALEDEVKSLGERMEARKLVGRAKAILMERHNLSEREAFRRIQTQSLTLNKPVHEIARAIITASEMALDNGGGNIAGTSSMGPAGTIDRRPDSVH
jgi:two-component system, response regulator PdtaR